MTDVKSFVTFGPGVLSFLAIEEMARRQYEVAQFLLIKKLPYFI
jgi:hypothetical protein